MTQVPPNSAAGVPQDLQEAQRWAVRELGGQYCGTSVVETLKKLTDQEVYTLLPQIVDSNGYSRRIDYDRNGVVENHEIRASLVVASRIVREENQRRIITNAQNQGNPDHTFLQPMQLSEVTLDQIRRDRPEVREKAFEVMGRVSGQPVIEGRDTLPDEQFTRPQRAPQITPASLEVCPADNSILGGLTPEAPRDNEANINLNGPGQGSLIR